MTFIADLLWVAEYHNSTITHLHIDTKDLNDTKTNIIKSISLYYNNIIRHYPRV